ncbi:hypothetical protein [Kitasatospora sp. A2-31]|nr:hypothetical protein [Kitasatospora sp. A2-31]
MHDHRTANADTLAGTGGADTLIGGPGFDSCTSTAGDTLISCP